MLALDAAGTRGVLDPGRGCRSSRYARPSAPPANEAGTRGSRTEVVGPDARTDGAHVVFGGAARAKRGLFGEARSRLDDPG